MNTLEEVLSTYEECTDIKTFENLDNMIYEFLVKENISDKEALKEACTSILSSCKVQEGYYEKNSKMSKEFFGFLLSVAMRLEKNVIFTNSYLREIYYRDYSEDNLYYVWNQFKRLSLKAMVVKDQESDDLLERIYRKSYDLFLQKVTKRIEKIPEKERDKNCVLVLSIQLLGMNHAPTKTLVERVKWLRHIGKKVYIINTTEQYLSAGKIPLYDPAIASVEESYRNAHSIVFGEDSFAFMQLSEKMTIERKLRTVLRIIQQIKPYYILSMGTGSMVADLCGQIVPTASMALAFSTLPQTMNPMRILGRTLREGEGERYREQGIDVIESRFTFELKPQEKYLTRKALGIPKDAFALVVVGIRLDYEIGEEFLTMLDHVCQKGCYVVFAGKMEHYDQWMESYVSLQKNSSFAGYQDDILALMENVDLYVNPERLGGGFSVIEAFAKGVPGVYLKTGDVYVSGGAEFAVSDYEQMEQEILHYKEDADFYEERSKMARQRAKRMTSSEEAIRDLDGEISRRVREKYW